MAVSHAQLDTLLQHAQKNKPFLIGLGHDEDEWSISYEFGREAPDSPMVGGAAYGVDQDFEVAMRQVLDDLHTS